MICATYFSIAKFQSPNVDVFKDESISAIMFPLPCRVESVFTVPSHLTLNLIGSNPLALFGDLPQYGNK